MQNNFCRAEIKGTEQIVVDPFDPRKHITVGQLNSQQNGSSGKNLGFQQEDAIGFENGPNIPNILVVL